MMAMMKLLRSLPLLLLLPSCSLASSSSSTCACACPVSAAMATKCLSLGQSCQTCFICGASIIAAMSMSMSTMAMATPFAYFTALFAVIFVVVFSAFFFSFAGILLLKMFRWIVEYEICLPDAVVFNLKGLLFPSLSPSLSG